MLCRVEKKIFTFPLNILSSVYIYIYILDISYKQAVLFVVFKWVDYTDIFKGLVSGTEAIIWTFESRYNVSWYLKQHYNYTSRA